MVLPEKSIDERIQRGRFAKPLSWWSMGLTGICAAAAGRIAYSITVLALSLPMGEQRGYTGSPLWMALVLLNLVGWLPYLLWGGLAGVSYSLTTSRWGRTIVLITCLLCLWLNEMMWYQGGAYHINFRIQVFTNLFNPVFWKEAGILVMVWLFPHALSFLLMPIWMNVVGRRIEARFARR